MKPEVKELWVNALRSGEYEQGKNRLTTITTAGKEAHCCLGVLCDLAVKDGLDIEVIERMAGSEDIRTYDGTSSLLPASVVEWAGLQGNLTKFFDREDGPETDYGVQVAVPDDDGDGAAEGDTREAELAVLNDDGKTFAEIADLIEQYL